MTSYHDWVKEGEAELAAMRQPTREEDAALSLELARENAEQAEREEAEMAKQMIDDETGEAVDVAPEDVPPFALVLGEFVELDEGTYVRGADVTCVLEMVPYRSGTSRTYLCNVVQGEGGQKSSNWSIYPARKILQALNLALENGRQRRVERADF